MYVIAGVSGNTGSSAANALLAQNKPVRVIVRDPKKGEAWAAKGAEVAVADFQDVPALTRALAGAQGVYLLVPPNQWNQTGVKAWRAGIRDALVAAVKAAKPAHVVVLSSVGVQHSSGTGPIADIHPLEAAMRETGVPSTFVRAAYFMENWMGSVQGALASGQLYNALELDTKLPQIASHDIGVEVAKRLLDPVTKGVRVVELAGPEDLSFRETAAVLSKVAGKEITPVQVPIAGLIGSLVGMGASQEVAEGYGELTDGVNKGVVAFEGKGAEHVRGSTTLAAFFDRALAKR